MGKFTWLYFVLGAVLTWGTYVYTIDQGRTKLAQGVPPLVAGMRAFLFIGLAYFVLAVLIPGGYLMSTKIPAGQDRGFNLSGSVLSTIAGLLGAAGALCIVFAAGHARRAGVPTLLVAALVFAFAPIVNCLISLVLDPPDKAPSPLFFVGLALTALGAFLALAFRPEAGHAPAAPVHATPVASVAAQAS